jgi:hypothetical protein
MTANDERTADAVTSPSSSRRYLLQRNRGDAWPALLVPAERRVPNHYTALLELAGETPETSLQIEKDLPRTFAGRHELTRGSPTWGEHPSSSPAPRPTHGNRAAACARTGTSHTQHLAVVARRRQIR